MTDATTDTPTLRDRIAACRAAARTLATLPTDAKNRALHAMADALVAHEAAILDANARDLAAADAAGITAAMRDRLRLDGARVAAMADAVRAVAALTDPVGETSAVERRPSGIEVSRRRIPLGVVAMIYEARPNVTSDAAALCFKSGNAVVLRGGSEAFHANHAIAAALHDAFGSLGLPAAAVTLLPTTDRAALTEMLALSDLIDLVIPRGGEGLIRFVDEHSRIPVIRHYKGVCHLYVDSAADLDVARRLLIDGKASRPGVCNALETLLVHRDIAGRFLPVAGRALAAAGVEVRGCAETLALVDGATAATDDDYAAEFLDLVIAARVVDGFDDAAAHIARFGSNHTEVIATDDLPTARRFVAEIDASVVLVNASSRFSDGGELGLGAEIGISTTKLHAYGPMGLEALTTQKFVVYGAGETRHPVPG